MDPHAEAVALFGPCLIPDCPGSVWATGHEEIPVSVGPQT